MFRLTLTALALLLAASALLAQTVVYRWVDEDGVVHYSDQPRSGAEEVQLDNAPAISMPVPRRRPAARADSSTANDGNARAGYETIQVLSPAPEETLWNIGGVLEVALDLQPALKQGHLLRVYFDGNPLTVNQARFQLNEVYRGEHNLQAEVINQNGEVLARSEPTRFYVQQTSVLN